MNSKEISDMLCWQLQEFFFQKGKKSLSLGICTPNKVLKILQVCSKIIFPNVVFNKNKQ